MLVELPLKTRLYCAGVPPLDNVSVLDWLVSEIVVFAAGVVPPAVPTMVACVPAGVIWRVLLPLVIDIVAVFNGAAVKVPTTSAKVPPLERVRVFA